MSSSNSNLPTIILVVLVIIILGGFYYLDRSSSTTDIAAITETADTEGMIASKKKYEAHKSAFSHSGFSGSMKDYIAHTEGGMKTPKVVKEHTGYSGSGKEYIQKHKGEEIKKIINNAADHAGFSGSMKDYAAGKFDTRSSTTSSSSKPANKSSGSNTSSHKGYGGSVEDYLNKYK
jgi:hypothetical protein